jgi:cation transport ATPase
MTAEGIVKRFYTLLVAIFILCFIFVIEVCSFKGRVSAHAEKEALSFEELQRATTPEQRRALIDQFTQVQVAAQQGYQFPKGPFVVVGCINLVLLIWAFSLMRRDVLDVETAKKMRVDLILNIATFGAFVLSYLILRYRTSWSVGQVILLLLPVAMAIASVALFRSKKFYKLFYRKRKYVLTPRL